MKKGFTLIELLAVIVILAIIALIATPVILNIIDSSRESTQSITAQNYKRAIENSLVKKELNKEHVQSGTYQIMEDGNICLSKLENGLCENNDILKVETEGDRPKKGFVEILNNRVHNFTIYINGYKITIDSKGNITTTKSSEENTVCTLEEKSSVVSTYPAYGIYSIGDKIKCGTEYFYVVSGNNNSISMLSEYGLYLGDSDIDTFSKYEAVEVKQSNNRSTDIVFAAIPQYLKDYKKYLNNQGIEDVEVSMMSYEQAISFGCDVACNSNYPWLSSSMYWLGPDYDENKETAYMIGSGRIDWYAIWGYSCGEYQCDGYFYYELRPLVTIPISSVK